MCVDYRKLNTCTIKDAYTLHKIKQTFSCDVMDLKSDQVEMAEEEKHKAIFICPLGFWEFNRMSQGIQILLTLLVRCVGNLQLTEVLVFLDDLIVFSETLEEHEA